MGQVTVRVNGYSHTIGCKDGEEGHVQTLAQQIEDKVRLIRRYLREDGYWEVSVHFTGLTEQQEDVVRRRVFTELRVLRSRGVI